MAAALAVVVLANVPVVVHYWNVGAGITRDPIEIARFSVSWGDWISAPPTHWLYGDRLGVTSGAERQLFPGLGFVLVLALGLWWWVRHRDRVEVVAGAVTAAMAIWLSTGLATSAFLVPLHWPYELLYRYVPAGDNIRVPARFVVVAGLFLAPVLAAGWQAVHARVHARLPPGWATPGLLVLLASVATEALARPAWFEAAPDLQTEALPRGVESGGVLFLPLAEAVGPVREVRRMWMARTSQVALVNGYSGNVSPLYARLRSLQRAGTDEGTLRALYSWLRHVGVDTIVIEEPSSPLFDPSLLEPMAENVYRIPSVAPPAFETAPMDGVGLIAAQEGWSYPERNASDSWVWSTSRRAALVIPMDGRPRHTLSLRANSLVLAPLEVWWNGTRLGVQPVGLTPGWLDFPLPPAAAAAGWSAFELVGPAPTPVPESPDPRRLGLCLFEIRLR
jgi:hypothetical protein